MLKLVIYKKTYTLSLIGGYGNITKEKRSEHFDDCFYSIYNSLSFRLVNYFWETFGYKIKYKGQVYTFDNLRELSEFIANKTLI